MPSVCHCVVRHALTKAERKEAMAQLIYAREMCSTRTTMMVAYSLQRCPSNPPHLCMCGNEKASYTDSECSECNQVEK